MLYTVIQYATLTKFEELEQCYKLTVATTGNYSSRTEPQQVNQFRKKQVWICSLSLATGTASHI